LGADVGATLRAALFDRGWVDFAVESVSSERAHTAAGVFDRKGQRETNAREEQPGWEGSVLVRRRGTLVFPVDVDLILDDGTRKREHWDGAGDSIRLQWHGPQGLIGAIVDPEDRIAIDANLLNNRASAPGESLVPWRTMERVTYWMQLAIDLVSP
jgi:hypothetical protein